MFPTYILPFCARSFYKKKVYYMRKKNVHSEMKMFKFRPRRVSSVSGAEGRRSNKKKYFFFVYSVASLSVVVHIFTCEKKILPLFYSSLAIQFFAIHCFCCSRAFLYKKCFEEEGKEKLA